MTKCSTVCLSTRCVLCLYGFFQFLHSSHLFIRLPTHSSSASIPAPLLAVFTPLWSRYPSLLTLASLRLSCVSLHICSIGRPSIHRPASFSSSPRPQWAQPPSIIRPPLILRYPSIVLFQHRPPPPTLRPPPPSPLHSSSHSYSSFSCSSQCFPIS